MASSPPLEPPPLPGEPEPPLKPDPVWQRVGSRWRAQLMAWRRLRGGHEAVIGLPEHGIIKTACLAEPHRFLIPPPLVPTQRETSQSSMC